MTDVLKLAEEIVAQYDKDNKSPNRCLRPGVTSELILAKEVVNKTLSYEGLLGIKEGAFKALESWEKRALQEMRFKE